MNIYVVILVVVIIWLYYSRKLESFSDVRSLVPAELERNAIVIKLTFDTIKKTYPADMDGFDVYKTLLEANNITDPKVLSADFLWKLETLQNEYKLTTIEVVNLLKSL